MLMLERSPRDFLLGSLPSRGPPAAPAALSDHYRVISAADFRVASSHTRAHATMISALICSARHSARIPPSIPSADKTVLSFVPFLSPRVRDNLSSNVSISRGSPMRDTKENTSLAHVRHANAEIPPRMTNIFRSKFYYQRPDDKNNLRFQEYTFSVNTRRPLQE